MQNKIISKAPGRVCLFGDHQDYLGLPIIATTIDKEITIKAIKSDIHKEPKNNVVCSNMRQNYNPILIF